MAFNFNLFYGRRLFPSLTSHIINRFVLKIEKWESMYLWEGTLFGNLEKLAFNIEGNTSFRRRQMQRVFSPQNFQSFSYMLGMGCSDLGTYSLMNTQYSQQNKE